MLCWGSSLTNTCKKTLIIPAYIPIQHKNDKKRVNQMKLPMFCLILILCSQFATANETSDKGYFTIKVKESETLHKISKTYLLKYDYWRQLLKFNHLTYPKQIVPDLKLNIPYSISKIRLAKILSLYGRCQYITDAKSGWLEDQTNKMIRANTLVKSSTNSKIMLLLDSGAKITLVDSTDLYVKSLSREKNFYNSLLQLKKGAFSLSISSSAKEKIQIQTGVSLTTIISGECYTKIYADNHQKIAVYRGQAIIKIANKEIKLSAGEGLIIKNGLEPKKFQLPNQIDIR